MLKESIREDSGSLTRELRNHHVPAVLLAIFLGGAAIVILGGADRTGYRVIPALIWSLGFCVGGVLLGFLFAIPRTLPAGTFVAPSPHGAAPSDAGTGKPAERNGGDVPLAASGYNEINSNLVEVSDWLTKIIVGVGLVELKNLPGHAAGVAAFVAPSLAVPSAIGIPVAGGIMLFFSVFGFLAGYLLTRIYLAVIIKWADNMVIVQNDHVQLPGSERQIGVAALSLLQQDTLSDLQRTVAELASATPQNEESLAKVDAAATLKDAARAKRVLWVDDRPENNTLLVEQLIKAGISVEQATSTRQAMQMFVHRRYDAVVTDIGRKEENGYVPDAGIVLARQILRMAPDTPIIAVTSGNGAKEHGEAALQAGMRLVTTSGTRFIAALNKILYPDQR